MRRLTILAALLCVLAPVAGAQSGADPTGSSGDKAGRFIAQQQLPDGRTAVVAEGEGEPRSIGSYSIRLYGSANPDFPLDDFIAGVVVPRDGSVERLAVDDVNGDAVKELIVVVRSAGSGGYLSANAIQFDSTHVEVTGSVEGLPPDADPIAELKKAKP